MDLNKPIVSFFGKVFGEDGKHASISPWELARRIVKKDGLLALYTGLSAGIVRHATYTGMRMGAFQTLVDYYTDETGPPSLMVKSACGVVSGALGGLAGLPADVALTRMAADGNAPPEKRRNYTNVFNTMSRVAREEGATVLFRGLTATVVRGMVVNVSQLVSYVEAKEALLKYDLMSEDIGCHVVCSVFSALTATTCCLPPDIAKTRLQNMQIIDGKPQYKGMVDVWVKAVKKEGFFSLWKGFTLLLLRNGPQYVAFFVVYEKLTYLYKQLVLVPVGSKVK